MKKIVQRINFIFLALIFILFLSGCKHNVFNRKPREVSYKIKFSLEINGAVPKKYEQITDRAALPTVDTSNISYKFQLYEGALLKSEEFASYEESEYSITLPSKADYRLEVFGYENCYSISDCADSNLIMKGSSLINYQSKNLSIDLTPNLEGEGEVELLIRVASGLSIRKCIAVWDTDQYVFDVEEYNYFNLCTIDKIGLDHILIPAGNYNVEFYFYSDEECTNLVFWRKEIINVFANLKTDQWIISADDPYFDGEFYLTETALNKFKVSSSDLIYVEDTDGTANQAPDGSFYNPYTNLQDAVDAIIARNDGVTSYTIKLKNNINEKVADHTGKESYATIAPSAANPLKLEISSYRNNTFAIGLDAAEKKQYLRVLEIGENAVVNLKNLQITGGYAINGGGIYNKGTLSVDNLKIFSNEANAGVTEESNIGNGGGIYSTGNLTVTNSSITMNAAQSTGGGISLYPENKTIVFNMSDSIVGAELSEGKNTSIHGAGISIRKKGSFYVSTSIEKSKIIHNETPLAIGGTGGGIWYSGNDCILKETEVSYNKSYNGGGLFFNGGSVVFSDSTIIQGNYALQSGGGVYGYKSSVVEIEGEVLFKENSADCSAKSLGGGGIYIGEDENTDTGMSTLEVKAGAKLTMNGNTSATCGGAITAGKSTIVNLNNSYFSDNKTTETSKEYVVNGSAEEKKACGGTIAFLASDGLSTLSLIDSEITNSSSVYGGALYIAKPDYNDNLENKDFNSTELDTVYIYNCKADFGAAVYVENQTGLKINSSIIGDYVTGFTDGEKNPDYYSNNTFSNIANECGGAIYAGENAYLNISESFFMSNLAKAASYDSDHLYGGGVVYLESGYLKIVDSEIYGNASVGRGGTLCILDGDVFIGGTSLHHNFSNKRSPCIEIKNGDLLIGDNSSIKDNCIVTPMGGFGGAIHVPGAGEALVHIVDVSITNNDDTSSSYDLRDINVQGNNARLYIGEANAPENCKPFDGSIYTVSPIILDGNLSPDYKPVIYLNGSQVDGTVLLSNKEGGTDYVSQYYKQFILSDSSWYIHSDGKIYMTPELQVMPLKDAGDTLDSSYVYTISQASELTKFSQLVNSGNKLSGYTFRLENNIDLENIEFTPIGNGSNYFSGTFDGNGKAVTGIRINQTSTSNIGLFGYIRNAVIKDLYIEGTIAGDGNVGGIVGQAIDSYISSCVNNAEIKASSNSVGGIAGLFYDTVIENCINIKPITCNVNYVGGIAGQFNGGYLINSANLAAISCYNYVGGLIGRAGTASSTSEQNVHVINVYNVGSVEATASGSKYNGNFIGEGYTRIASSPCEFENYYSNSSQIPVGDDFLYEGSYLFNPNVFTSTSSLRSDLNSYVSSFSSPEGYNISLNPWSYTITIDGTAYPSCVAIPEGVSIGEGGSGENPETDPALPDINNNHTSTDELPSLDALPSEMVNAKGVPLPGTTVKISKQEDFQTIFVWLRDKATTLDQVTFVLANDIECTGNATIIGGSSNSFTGILDGNNYAIKNFVSSDTRSYAGFFSHLASGAVVKNLTLEIELHGTGDYTGGIAGKATGNILIDNCNVTIKNTGTGGGTKYAGGLIGYCESSAGESDEQVIIRNCVVTSEFINGSYVGGIVGYSTADCNLTIENCASYSNFAYGSTGSINDLGRNGGVGGIGGELYSNNLVLKNLYQAITVAYDKVAPIVHTISPSITDTSTFENIIYNYNSGSIDITPFKVNGTGLNLSNIPYGFSYSYSEAQETYLVAGDLTYKGNDYSTPRSLFNAWVDNKTNPNSYRKWVWENGKLTLETISPSNGGSSSGGSSVSNEHISTDSYTSVSNTYSVPAAGTTLKLSSEEEIAKINEWVTGGNTLEDVIFVLSGDITCTGKLDVIGSSTKAFAGTFDGNNYSIRDYENQTQSTYIGLFSTLASGAVIKNLTISGELKSYNYAGGIAAQVTGEVLIDNCNVNLTMTYGSSNKNIGGIVGYAGGTAVLTIRNSVSSCKFTNGSNIGGLVGSTTLNSVLCIENSASYCKFEGVKSSGGIGGYIQSTDLTMKNVYFDGILSDFAANSNAPISYQVTRNSIGTQKVENIFYSYYKTMDNDDISPFNNFSLDSEEDKNYIDSINYGYAYALDVGRGPSFVAGALVYNGISYTFVDDLLNAWVNNQQNADAYKEWVYVDGKLILEGVELDNTTTSDHHNSIKDYDITGSVGSLNSSSAPTTGAYTAASVGDILKISEWTQSSSLTGVSFILVDDIELPDDFDTIGSVSNPFGGTFDGNNYSIINFKLKDSSSSGFFGCVDGGTIKNLKLQGSASFAEDSTSSGIGGLVGEGKGNITISNCLVDVTISGGRNSQNVGGLIGEYSDNNSGTLKIINCINYGAVTSSENIGGLVGYINASDSSVIIQNCANFGTITQTEYNIAYACGGLVGRIICNEATFQNCVNNGSIIGGNRAGFYGIVSVKNSISESGYLYYNTAGCAPETSSLVNSTYSGTVLSFSFTPNAIPAENSFMLTVSARVGNMSEPTTMLIQLLNAWIDIQDNYSDYKKWIVENDNLMFE